MMHFMDIMDQTGHTKVSWDPDDKESVKVAKETFIEMLKKGYKAFTVDRSEKKGQQIKEFDPSIKELLLIPQLQGG
jgi:hypothetical protein